MAPVDTQRIASIHVAFQLMAGGAFVSYPGDSAAGRAGL